MLVRLAILFGLVALACGNPFHAPVFKARGSHYGVFEACTFCKPAHARSPRSPRFHAPTCIHTHTTIITTTMATSVSVVRCS